MKHLPTLIRESGIFADPSGRSTRSRHSELYATDPVYREARKRSARRWNAENADRKRESDRKWAQTHGADASRRYRLRQKEKSNAKRG